MPNSREFSDKTNIFIDIKISLHSMLYISDTYDTQDLNERELSEEHLDALADSHVSLVSDSSLGVQNYGTKGDQRSPVLEQP